MSNGTGKANTATGTICGVLLAACLPGIATAQAPEQGHGPAAPAATAFHPPSSAAERALDAIIRRDDRDPALFEFAVKRPDRKKAKDQLYARYFSPGIQDAWLKAERALVNKDCGGNYQNGEICGLDYSPITCAQDHSETGYAYDTLKEDGASASIQMKWIELDKPAATYRMIRQKDGWILDGVACAEGESFNWK